VAEVCLSLFALNSLSVCPQLSTIRIRGRCGERCPRTRWWCTRR
jgi:hypothetical protein